MEQLINAATMPYWATMVLYLLGGAFIGVAILIFIAEHGNIKEEVKVIIALLVIGAILLVLGVHCKTFTVDITIKLNPLSKMLLLRNILMQQNLDLN